MQNGIVSFIVPALCHKIFYQMVIARDQGQLEFVIEELFLMHGVVMEGVLVVPTEGHVEHAADELVPGSGK